MFTGFSWFSGRDKHRICHDLRHQFGSMFARVVTMSRPPEKHLKFTAKFRLRLQPAGESPANLSQIVAFHAFGADPHRGAGSPITASVAVMRGYRSFYNGRDP